MKTMPFADNFLQKQQKQRECWFAKNRWRATAGRRGGGPDIDLALFLRRKLAIKDIGDINVAGGI